MESDKVACALIPAASSTGSAKPDPALAEAPLPANGGWNAALGAPQAKVEPFDAVAAGVWTKADSVTVFDDFTYGQARGMEEDPSAPVPNGL